MCLYCFYSFYVLICGCGWVSVSSFIASIKCPPLESSFPLTFVLVLSPSMLSIYTLLSCSFHSVMQLCIFGVSSLGNWSYSFPLCIVLKHCLCPSVSCKSYLFWYFVHPFVLCILILLRLSLFYFIIKTLLGTLITCIICRF